ncbi:Flavohemoprotein [Sinobacterium norvegicum]|uniref:nitric oxide dioxygenase n=1 Tax=Sinobacterium norvegicum TaxID=1641715 RepID=A0ABM9AEX0_9GAMM|nr:NO-inducible flavohemoprotein [Sinobacterium norvegicum]CAH0991585.1 Flavohemoprotein [Sinobacterium norvegicum]
MSLSEQTVAIVKATAPAVKQHSTEITGRFYTIMLDGYPEVRPYFNATHQSKGTQAKALADSVVAYALNIDKLHNLGPVVGQIVAKHVSLDIKPEHYAIVGKCLLEAIAEVLGDAVTDEVAAAWGEAYNFLADLLIGAEEEVYQAKAAEVGGWRGEREFVIDKIVDESEVIKSFYLKPADGGDLMGFAAGQYICVVAEVNGEQIRRNYSLSDAPNNDYYRISVKREESGAMSSFLHQQCSIGDHLQLLAPSGEFTAPQSQRPLLLVTGGVGITPAISIANDIAKHGRKIDFVHAAINSKTHAFKQHTDQLAEQHEGFNTTYVYSEPLANDQANHHGFISQEMISALLPSDKKVDFLFLGPKPFMQAMRNIARNLNISDEYVRFEFFGPLEEI